MAQIVAGGYDKFVKSISKKKEKYLLKTYEYNVDMTCEGCSNAVNRVLGKIPAITNIRIDLPSKKVFVTTTLDHDKVLESIKKTGKACSFVGVEKL